MGMLEEVELSNGISLKTIIDEYVAKYGDPSSGGGGIPLHYHDIDEILELRELLVGTAHRLDILEAGGGGDPGTPVSLAPTEMGVSIYTEKDGVTRPMNPEALELHWSYRYGNVLTAYISVVNGGKCNSDPVYWIVPDVMPHGEMKESLGRLFLEAPDHRDYQLGVDMILKAVPGLDGKLGYYGRLPVEVHGVGGRYWGKIHPNDGQSNTSWATSTGAKWRFTGVW